LTFGWRCVIIADMELLQNQLKEAGIRPSLHRLKILEYLDKNRIHPTVDLIYESLRREVPTISKTTIYNTLSLFVEKGVIGDLTISGYDVRYDAEAKPHAHFLCKQCGKIFDLKDIKCPHNSKEVRGNKIEEVHLYFKGICEKCTKGGI